MSRNIHRFVLLALALIGSMGAVVLPVAPAQAQCCDCSCTVNQYIATRNMITNQSNTLRRTFTTEMRNTQLFIIGNGDASFFRRQILSALKLMSQSLATTAMMQTMAVGSFLDAKEQMETQRLFAQLKAEAHRDYAPDVGMCTFGTAAISLAASDRHGEVAAVVLARNMLDRQLAQRGSVARGGPAGDRNGRVERLRARFCDRDDMNSSFRAFCPAAVSADTRNKDIDYGRALGFPLTLGANLANGATLEPADEDLLALASNLYGHDVFSPFPAGYMNDQERRYAYMDMRAVVAKRSVALNSFAAIAGMKAGGSANAANTGTYLSAVLSQLGVADNAHALQMLGNQPSYYALLDVLAQKIYQDPEFYTNLYDKPANVLRKNVAMQAINLMLDRDAYKSELRSEAVMAVLLEMEIAKQQAVVQNRLSKMGQDSLPF